jgi:hypothetical protein
MSIMVLQNSTDHLKVEPGSSSEICPTSHDGKQMIDTKVEEVSHTQELEDPLLITLPEIKAKHEVSCMSVSIVVSQISIIVVFFILVCLLSITEHW